MPDPLLTNCPGCGKSLQFSQKRLGSLFDHSCGIRFLLELEDANSSAPATGEAPPDCHQMHCPGCFRRLKYPAFAEGLATTHSCGESLSLCAEPLAIEDDGSSEYLEDLELLRFAARPAQLAARVPSASPGAASATLPRVETARPAAATPRRSRTGTRAESRPTTRSGIAFLAGILALMLVVAGLLARALDGQEQRAQAPIARTDPQTQAPPEPTSTNLPALPGSRPEAESGSQTETRSEAEPPLEIAYQPAEDDGLPPPIVLEEGRSPASPAEVEEAGVSEGAPPEVEEQRSELEEPSEPWDVRFARLADEHKQLPSSQRDSLLPEFYSPMDESLQLARLDLDTCLEILAFYSGHNRVFKAEAQLRLRRDDHRRVYFQHMMQRASGPGQWRELADQCKDWGLDSERALVMARLNALQPTTTYASVQALRRDKRAARYELRQELAVFIREERLTAFAALTEIIEWMAERRFAPESARTRLENIITGLELEDEEATELRGALHGLSHMVASDELAKLQKSFASKVERAIAKTVTRLGKALENCLKKDLAGQAFDLLQTLLKLDPDNKNAHEGLGHVLIDGVWYRHYEAEKLAEGLVWHDSYGWVPIGEEARYAALEIFDQQEQRWVSLSQANAAHAEITDPWRLESENFVLVSTADLHLSALVLLRLEAVFLQVFRQYDLFFKGDQGAMLIFGMGKLPEKLVVNLYRSHEQFTEHAKPPTDWAAGFYSGRQGASFFYCTGDRVSFTTLQHELIHQILGELSPGSAPSWLAEGAAVYLEDAFFAGEHLSLGSISDHSRIISYLRKLRQGEEEHSFEKMLTFRSGREWDSGDISQNYRGAGAIVYFMMHFDDGRYRGDFLELLRDRYQRVNRPPEYYLGMTHETLDELMAGYYQNVPLEASERRR